MSKAILANGTLPTGAATRQRDDTANGQPKAAEGRKLSQWLLAIPILLLFFGVLAYAEIVWLHDLPHDSATRVALVAFPDPRAGGTVSGGWSDRLMHEATNVELMQALSARLDLRDPSTGQPVSPESLTGNMRLGSECIEINSGQTNAVRGLLLYNVVRGADAKTTDAVAAEWAKAFTQRSAANLPGLTVQPVDSLGVPYEICR